MERGTNGCSWFNVLDYESSSNSDFLRWMKSSGAGSEVSIMAAHHQQTIPFLPVDQVTFCYGGGGGGGGGGGFPFTNSQRKELERQATIYKCMISSVPVPHHLLFPLDSPVSWYGGRYSRKGDLEPGRCKRTDGKKWRCSREVAPLQKYCDRHLHRGRPRSRKPVELNKKTRLHQNKPPPSASASTAIEAPLPSKTDLLAISTPYYKETINRVLDSKQPWQNLMESDYRSSFDQDFTAQQQQPLNLLSYPNLPSGFIDAWSIENLNSRSVESSIRSSEGDLSPSLNLSMAMAVGEVLDEQMRNIQTEAPAKIEKQAIWWEGGGPLGEALQLRRSPPDSVLALRWQRVQQPHFGAGNPKPLEFFSINK